MFPARHCQTVLHGVQLSADKRNHVALLTAKRALDMKALSVIRQLVPNTFQKMASCIPADYTVSVSP